MTSPQRRTALTFLSAFEHLDVPLHLSLRTPTCLHSMAPSSLNYPPSMTNSQFATHLSSLQPLLSSFPVYAKEIFHADGSNQVTVWATSNAVFRDEVKDEEGEWKYEGEYMFVLCLDDSGERIERILEFLDSKKVVEVWGLMKRARRNLAASKGVDEEEGQAGH